MSPAGETGTKHLGSVRKRLLVRLVAHIHRSRFMAGRYELPEGTCPLIADLFERKKQRGGLVEMIGSCSMAFASTESDLPSEHLMLD